MIYENLPPLTREEIDRGKAKLPEKGYPPTEFRLHIPRLCLGIMLKEEIHIADNGPWHITEHPNRLKGIEKGRHVEPLITNETPAHDEKAQQWRARGLWTDTANRPLHPRFWQLLTLPDVGMYTGPGFYYGYGPQQQANLGVKRVRNKTEYAVVRKHKSDTWRLPGGHVEPHHTSVKEAAFDEGWQEAGLDPTKMGNIALKTIFSPPKGFSADTLHAWGEEYFTFLTNFDNPALEGLEELTIYDTEEIADARWMDIQEIAYSENFGHTHRDRILENEGMLL